MTRTRISPSEPGVQRRALLRGAAATLVGSSGVTLLGCGGGEERPAPAEERKLPLSGVDSGGTGAPAYAFFSAAIQSTLPLVVSGVQFDTGQATVTDGDGNLLDLRTLAPGMNSQIESSAIGTVGAQLQARARSIRVGEQLLGPVSAIDLSAHRIVLLGQSVDVTAATLFDVASGHGLTDVRVGATVRVWGQLDIAGGRIVATRIDTPASVQAFVVRGVLTELDRNTGSIAIGPLKAIGADTLVLPADVSPGVVVRARLVAATGATLYTVSSVRNDALQLPDHVHAEVEGRVTQWVSAQHFSVDGVSVDASAATFAPSGDVPTLGSRVEVEGRSQNGVLMARSVQIEADEEYELEGTISVTDAAARTFVVRGITVSWGADTTFAGGSARLLAARRKVAVRGKLSADRQRLQARRIHVEA